MTNTTAAEAAVTGLCNAAMVALANALRLAAPDAPLTMARARLGEDRFINTAIESLRRHMKRVLIDERDQRAEDMRAAPGWAAQTAIATVVADTIHDICNA